MRLKRLRRAVVIEVIPWNGSIEPEIVVPPTPKEPRDPLKLARYYQSLLGSGKFEDRASLARYLGVSRHAAMRHPETMKMAGLDLYR